MRLWSLHPRYLDKYGLIALWREGLLAQAALNGGAKGYQNHPQFDRFKRQQNPLQAIGSYLSFIVSEALSQGYKFNHEKILFPNFEEAFMPVDAQTLAFEAEHLKGKLKQRDKAKYDELSQADHLLINPIFNVQ